MSGYTVKRDSGLFIGDVDVAPASGTIEITENGEYDVARYATADVNVKDNENVAYSMMVKRFPLNISENRFSILPTNEYRVNDDLQDVGDYAFAGMLYCETIDLSNIKELHKVGIQAFYSGKHTSGTYNVSYLQNIIFPENKSQFCFIEHHAFEGCNSLTSLNLMGFFRIGTECFKSSGVRTLYFSYGVSFDQVCFGGATNLTDIYYTGTQEQWETTTNIGLAQLDSSVTVHYNYIPN